MTAPVVRLGIGLIPKANSALNWLVQHTGLSKTDVLNRAVQLYQFAEQAEVDGAYLGLIRPDGTVERVRLL